MLDVAGVKLDLTINVPTLITVISAVIVGAYRFARCETKVDVMFTWWESTIGGTIPPAPRKRRPAEG